MFRYWMTILTLAIAGSATGWAQQDTTTLQGSLRLRSEYWDWFDTSAANDSYLFHAALLRGGATGSRGRFHWNVELAAPLLVNLPDDAIAPAPQGQLGLGAAYFAANGERNTASLFLKQALAEYRDPRQFVRVGRFEFIDGTEITPPDARLAALRRERVAHRLLGNFGFSHVGRSFGGVHYSRGGSGGNLTVAALRPTEGVFKADPHDRLDVRVLYGAWNRAAGRTDHRIFVIGYNDDRNVLKVDNRPLAQRQQDREAISIATFGGHSSVSFNGPLGPSDLLFWGALQTGDWGRLDHRAAAATVELSTTPAATPRVNWRIGGFRSTGDDDPGDGRHETFFQLLPTPRVYARFPFYNLMNHSAAFLDARYAATPRFSVNGGVHRIRLTSGSDLWYAGGGAFERGSFGYAGRPAGGSTSLATVFDASAELRATPQWTAALYAGYADGGGVIDRIHPEGSTGAFVFAELRRSFSVPLTR
jgi:hypothetical protein